MKQTFLMLRGRAVQMSERARLAMLGALFAPQAFALNNDVDLDIPGDGPLAKVGAIMQEVVDFLGGPGVLCVVFIGLVAAWALWVVVPKSGGAALGWVARAVAGGVMVFNIALFFTWLEGF